MSKKLILRSVKCIDDCSPKSCVDRRNVFLNVCLGNYVESLHYLGRLEELAPLLFIGPRD